jgi:DNA-binding SARP family transcriptional activator
LIDSTRGALPRERAARLLWEDADTSRRAGNLRQLLARVKEAQLEEGFELFTIGADTIEVATDAVVADVRTLIEARADTADRRLLDLCRAYGGDLLAGLDEGGEEFTRWLWNHREMLRQQFVTVVAANVEATIGVLEPEEVISIARRLVEADPYQEVGHRVLMRVHAGKGDFDSALRIHRRLVDLLRETGGRPSAETLALLSEISARNRQRSQTSAERTAEPDIASDPVAMSFPTRSMRLPHLALDFAGIGALSGHERQWAEALFEDAALQLWRTRAFVVTRPSDIRARSIDLINRTRREPSDYVVDFRVAHRDGERLVTAALTCSSSGEILWIHRFVIGEPLGRAIRDLLVNCVQHVEQNELRALADGPEFTTAYRLTVQGNRLLRTVDLPSVRRARQVFRAALSVDPGHAPTLAAVSKAYRLEWLLLARADHKELDIAIDFARQSIAAGPDSVHGLHQYGICSIYKKDYERGLSALARAEKHFPFQVEVVAEHSDGLICYGDLQSGLQKLAPILDDEFLVSDPVLWNAACGNYLTGNYRETLDLIARMSTDEPVHHLKAACLAMVGEVDEARRQVAKLRDVLPDFSIAKRLAMAPLRRLEDLEHYEFGLKLAGFD